MPIRPKGIPAMTLSFISSGNSLVISVSIKPGATELTRIFRPLQFLRQRFGKGIQRRFFHRVGNLAGIARMADYTGNIDDAAGLSSEA
ncbi:MAG: hypothetical protein MZV70_52655 [Desulfobacterales bacterium]|nr:hypothetical protein [Desulfobacterales bacterium]